MDKARLAIADGSTGALAIAGGSVGAFAIADGTPSVADGIPDATSLVPYAGSGPERPTLAPMVPLALALPRPESLVSLGPSRHNAAEANRLVAAWSGESLGDVVALDPSLFAPIVCPGRSNKKEKTRCRRSMPSHLTWIPPALGGPHRFTEPPL